MFVADTDRRGALISAIVGVLAVSAGGGILLHGQHQYEEATAKLLTSLHQEYEFKDLCTVTEYALRTDRNCTDKFSEKWLNQAMNENAAGAPEAEVLLEDLNTVIWRVHYDAETQTAEFLPPVDVSEKSPDPRDYMKY